MQQTESLNKIWKREGDGLSFKAFAEKYNKEKDAKVVQFSEFSGKKPVSAGQLKWNNADGAVDQPVTQVNTVVVKDDIHSKIRPVLIGVAIGVIGTLLVLKYKKNG
jgi:hypothetical protein